MLTHKSKLVNISQGFLVLIMPKLNGQLILLTTYVFQNQLLVIFSHAHNLFVQDLRDNAVSFVLLTVMQKLPLKRSSPKTSQ